MTYREMYTAVINGQITDEVITTAQNALAKLDERNAKRAAAPKKVNEESVALMGQIAELMADGETRIAKVIGEILLNFDWSASIKALLHRAKAADLTAPSSASGVEKPDLGLIPLVQKKPLVKL